LPPSLTFVTGGARSGKSRYALDLALRSDRPAFLATAEPFDDGMRDRIRRHREERGERCLTVEEPVDLAGALRGLPPETGAAVVDCLTVWLGNLLYRREGRPGPPSADLGDYEEIRAFLDLLAAPPCPLIVVSNEVGMGIIADNALARLFTDLTGRLNQEVAARAGRVVFLVSGIPLVVKEAV
jgi:adenosylcobinamide kinase/adenosylcobinamide-phosphate guanylyltransferase